MERGGTLHMLEMIVASNIFWIIITFIQVFLIFSMITSILRIRVKWWVTLAYSIILAPITSENQWLMLGIFIVGSFIYYFLTSKMQWKVTALAIVTHLFSSVLIANLLQFSALMLSSFFEISHIAFRIISVFIHILLLSIVKYKKFAVTNLMHNKMAFTVSLLMFSVSCAIFVYMPIISEEVFDTANILDSLLRIIIKLSIAYLVIILNKFATEIEKHEFHSLYTDTLKESLDHLSMFKHDSRNIINTLFGFCRLEQWHRIEPFLQELTNDIRRDINIGTVNSQLKDNMPYLYGIVLAKSAMAAADGIDFEIRINAKKFELFTVSEVQLSRMVGNLLNNAFDAAKQCDYKRVDLNISNFNGYRIKIEVINSVNSPVDISNILKKGYTTKEGHTGLGLYQVHTIIDRQIREGFNVKISFHNSPGNTFTAELLI